MSDRVDSLVVIPRVDFAPGKVTVALAEAIEIAQTFHAANISFEQEMDQAVVTGASNPGQRIQENLKKCVKSAKNISSGLPLCLNSQEDKT